MPDGSTPVRNVWTKSPSLHAAIPVGSGVRLDGLAGKPFGGWAMPAKSRLLSGADRIPPRGVWHSAQSPTCCERYPPYAAVAPRGGALIDCAGFGPRNSLPSLNQKLGL